MRLDEIVLPFALAFISFFAASIFVFYSPISAFYLFPFRAWELLLGAVLATIRRPNQQSPALLNYCSMAGLAMIVAGVFLYSETTLFPGLSAAIPTLGAALFIWAGNGEVLPRMNYWMTVRPIVFIGKISYSLYLWHFVLFVFGAYLTIGPLSPARTISLLVLSFVLATLSYYLVEQPVRTSDTPSLKGWPLFGATGAATAFLLIVGFSIRATDGFDYRTTAEQMELNAAVEQRELKAAIASITPPGCVPMSRSRAELHQFCNIGQTTSTKSSPSFFVWGDLHAWMLYTALETISAQQGASGWASMSYGCAPLTGIPGDRTTPDCMALNDSVLRFIISESGIRHVVLIGRWAYYTQFAENNHTSLPIALELTVRALVTSGKNVWILGPTPEIIVGAAPGKLIDLRRALYLKTLGIGVEERVEPTRDEFNDRQSLVLPALKEISKKYSVKVLWPHDKLCNQKICMTVADGKPLYVDFEPFIFFWRTVCPTITCGDPVKMISQFPSVRFRSSADVAHTDRYSSRPKANTSRLISTVAEGRFDKLANRLF